MALLIGKNTKRLDIHMAIVILKALNILMYIIQGILFVRILFSWIRVDSLSRLIEILYHLTEPILAPIRVMVKHSIFGDRKGGLTIDISPLIAFIFLQFIQLFILRMITYVTIS